MFTPSFPCFWRVTFSAFSYLLYNILDEYAQYNERCNHSFLNTALKKLKAYSRHFSQSSISSTDEKGDENLTSQIGERLKEVRLARNLSQRQLAIRSGVTNGMISMIEQDRASPTISSLKKILDGIPMSLAEFFSIEDSQDEKYIYRADSQVDVAPPVMNNHGELQDKSLTYRLIGNRTTPIEMLHEIYAPGGDTSDELYSHTGHECGVVVEGEIELTIGDTVYTLSAGDGYSFPSEQPHRFRNIKDERAVVVSACTPASF